jgi:hypothetical protein
MQNCIPLDQCIEGGLYQIRSRNLNYGVFTENRFIGIREKFGYVYLESVMHYRYPLSFWSRSIASKSA